MRSTVIRAWAAVIVGAGLASTARATYVVTIQPVGPDVVAVGSGSLNTAALQNVGGILTPATIAPVVARIDLGPTASTICVRYNGVSVVNNFGPGSVALATGGTGPRVGANLSLGQIEVPVPYVSGTPIGVSTNTWSDITYAGLGLKPGTYVSTWGTGATADSFTVNVLIPEPSTAVVGVGGFALLARRRRATRG